MEANFFRILCAELAPELVGSRIEKIWSPAPGVWTLGFGGGGGKRFLLCRARPAPGLLFLSPSRPANPLAPPARAMWLRKRVLGRRAVGLVADWPRLRLALALTDRVGPAPQPTGGRFLLLDLRAESGREILLMDDLPEGFGQEPDWPEPADLPALLAAPAPAASPPEASSAPRPPQKSPAPDSRSDLWRRHPQLSPPLRRTLAALLADGRADEAGDLLSCVRAGQAAACHVYADAAGPRDPLPFELPPALSAGLTRLDFPNALEAARAQGEALLFAGLARIEDAQERAEETARRKRTRKALARVEEDDRRLRAMAALSRQAEALQANLHLLGEGPTPARIALDHPEHGPMALDLDPRLSPSANMERLFALAAKGKRGLAFAAARRELLLTELSGSAPTAPPGFPPLQGREAESPGGKRGQAEDASSPWPARGPGASAGASSGPGGPAGPGGSGGSPPKLFRTSEVKLFRSSDGFWLARGRNQGANHRLLTKAASPFDYWLHAEGGPGAHVIVKRDHPGQAVPRQTLLEAAALAGLASWRARDGKADVLLALVKDVRPMKGAAMGEVRVEAVLETLRPDLDPALEPRLAVAVEPTGRPPAKGGAHGSRKR